MANHPRSSNNAANRMPLQPRTGVSAMHSTDATTTAMNQHDAADELPLHNAEGSTTAEDLLAKSKKVVGGMELWEAAKDYPVDAWRVWTEAFPRSYTEDSPDFDAKLEIFKRNAELVRRVLSEDPSAGVGLMGVADWLPYDEFRSGTRIHYPGIEP